MILSDLAKYLMTKCRLMCVYGMVGAYKFTYLFTFIAVYGKAKVIKIG